MKQLQEQTHKLFACVRKQRYYTYKYACQIADSMAIQHPGAWRFVAYACPICQGFHVGRQWYDDSERYFYSAAFTTPIKDQLGQNGHARKETDDEWLDEND